jgi:response regulator RpfG family c-di-GMP phosphodiesterase
MTFTMPNRSREEIIAFMRGIIAAEACINYRLSSGHRRVFITATNDDERAIFSRCLNKLGVETTVCKPIKDIVISRIENIYRLHELDLMSLNQEKHKVFLEMIKSYRGRWP